MSLATHNDSDVLFSTCMCFCVGMELRVRPLRKTSKLFMRGRRLIIIIIMFKDSAGTI